MGNAGTCECGNKVDLSNVELQIARFEPIMCEWCIGIADEPPHTGHYSLMGTYWCDTCNSPLCDLI